ncbi:unnamed protein product [Ixodes pacificus]
MREDAPEEKEGVKREGERERERGRCDAIRDTHIRAYQRHNQDRKQKATREKSYTRESLWYTARWLGRGTRRKPTRNHEIRTLSVPAVARRTALPIHGVKQGLFTGAISALLTVAVGLQVSILHPLCFVRTQVCNRRRWQFLPFCHLPGVRATMTSVPCSVR